MKPSLLIVIPTYGHFDYAERAIRSAFLNTVTAEPIVVLLDDASPDWDDKWAQRLRDEFFSFRYVHFYKNNGLTRMWNEGLIAAHCSGAEFTCVTNSDVLFTYGWDMPLIAALTDGEQHLVGPVTNAPGNVPCQFVGLYTNRYRLSDDMDMLNSVGKRLRDIYGSECTESEINGFCMVARTTTWWQNAYDRESVFRPKNDFDSRGRPNATPLMTLNECELQGRWRNAGLKIGYCRGSFVWHYRAVTRGDQHKCKGAYRMKT